MVDRFWFILSWIEGPVLQSFLQKNVWNSTSPQQQYCAKGINTALLDIPCWNRSCPGSVFRVLESPVTKKPPPKPYCHMRHKLLLHHWAPSYSFLSSYSMFSTGFCNKNCKYYDFFHNNHAALYRKKVWPSTSDAMPNPHSFQDEAISPSLRFLALVDRQFI